MRKVYILPNLFTAGSLFAGMLAIFEVFNGNPDSTQQACLMILLSALLDVADGAIARLTRTTSSFGLNFDSLADLVAFGVAPAMLAFDAFGGNSLRLAAAVCSLYVVCGALRLARFNVQSMREEKKTFRGLPIPSAAMATISIIWVFDANPELNEWIAKVLPGAPEKTPLASILPLTLVVIAYLMVSKVPFHGLKSINLASRQPFEILVTIVIIALLIYLLKQHLDIVLAVVIWIYIILGVIFGLNSQSKTQPGPEDPELPASSPPKRINE